MKKTKLMCRGCREDYYNHNVDGGCWMFSSAQIVERVRVGVWEEPPYAKERKQHFLSCFNPQGDVMLRLDDCRVKPTKFIEAQK